MSKELIERLKSYIPNGDGYNSQYANDLADAVDALESAAAQRQPVEWRCRVAGSDHYAHFPTKRCRFCEPLYTAQQQSAVPDGWKLVPVEPTPEMVSAAEEAHMPFGDMDIALRMAILSAPSAPATVQGDGWIPIIERLPQIKQVLSEKCTLEGREIPTLYRSGMVLTFDGSRVSAGIVEWFHSKSPLNNVTHWMPLPAAPALSAAQAGGGEV